MSSQFTAQKGIKSHNLSVYKKSTNLFLLHHSTTALEAYDAFMKSLGSMRLSSNDFSLQYYQNADLSEGDFHEVMDEFDIPPVYRLGGKKMQVNSLFPEKGQTKRSVFLFARKNERDCVFYDVFVAKASNYVPNRIRLATVTICDV